MSPFFSGESYSSTKPWFDWNKRVRGTLKMKHKRISIKQSLLPIIGGHVKIQSVFPRLKNTFGLAMSNPHPKYGHMMTYAKYFLNIVIHIFFNMQISVRSHWAVKKRDTTRRHDPFFCQPALEEPEKSLPYTLILAKIAKAKS